METYPETLSLPSLMEEARREGGVRIRRSDGETFVLTPEQPRRSPLDVAGIDLDLSTEEIIEFIREGRRGSEYQSE